jgi:hypothetical protein
MRVGLAESFPGELAELSPLDVLHKAETGLNAALRELGYEDVACALEGRLEALTKAENALSDVEGAGVLRKALPERGGELDVVALLAGRMEGAYRAQAERLAERIKDKVLSGE